MDSQFQTTIRTRLIIVSTAATINYMRNSVKVVIDAYDGTTTFYVFDPEDPIIAAYRRIFPGLFKDAAAMPADLRKHVRYPELLLKLQAEVYGLYHMTDTEAFYNREDLWTVATEVGMSEGGEQTTQTMEPNFVLMKLPGRKRYGVRGDSAIHAGQSQQSDWLDRRAQRWRALRHVGRLQLSQDKASRRPAADRSAHRSKRAALRTTDAVESARFARASRRSARDSDCGRRCCMRSRFTCRPNEARCPSCVWWCSLCRIGLRMDQPSSRRWQRCLEGRRHR